MGISFENKFNYVFITPRATQLNQNAVTYAPSHKSATQFVREYGIDMRANVFLFFSCVCAPFDFNLTPLETAFSEFFNVLSFVFASGIHKHIITNQGTSYFCALPLYTC